MEMSVHRVHGRSDPPPVSPTPPTSTQRRHGHINRVSRGGRSYETTPRVFAPAPTVSTPLHGACVDRVGGLLESGLARELIVAVATWLAHEYTALLIKVFDRLSRHGNAFALAQLHLDFSQF